MFKPYEGTEPYIFVSYARENKHIIDPILEAMNRVGYRVWYDEGVHLTEKWRKVIAEHVYNCAVLIAFHSTASIKSEHCKSEIESALDKSKLILPVYLEKVELPPELDMYLRRIQAISFDDAEKLLNSLNGEPAFEQCRKPRQENLDIPQKSDVPVKTEVSQKPDVPAKTEVPQKSDNIQSKPDTQRKENAKNAPQKDPKRVISSGRSEEIREKRKTRFDTCRAHFKRWSIIALITLALTIWGYDANKALNFFAAGLGLCMTMGVPVFIAFTNYSSARDNWERVRNQFSILEWYVTRDGALTISNAGEANQGIIYRDYTPGKSVYVSDENGWLGIQSIIIKPGISEIYGYSFQNYEFLTSVKIRESVKKIHSHAFENCKKLKSVTIPAGTDYEKYAFPPWTDIHRE